MLIQKTSLIMRNCIIFTENNKISNLTLYPQYTLESHLRKEITKNCNPFSLHIKSNLTSIPLSLFE